jgi:hypothetical protein
LENKQYQINLTSYLEAINRSNRTTGFGVKDMDNIEAPGQELIKEHSEEVDK